MRNIGSPQLGQRGLSFTPKPCGFPRWSRINRAPPEPDLKNSASKRGKCVDSRTDQRRRSGATRLANPISIWQINQAPDAQRARYRKAADQAFNQGLETRGGKDCPDRFLIRGAPSKQTSRTAPEQCRLSVVRFGGVGMISIQISRILCWPSPEVCDNCPCMPTIATHCDPSS